MAFSPNGFTPGLMVPAELYFNYDSFRDCPIVQQLDLGKEPALQYYTWTSEFSKALGSAINVSPAKIDHLITGWTGSWGRNILALSNAIADPQRRSEELYDWPLTQRFVKNLARGSDASEKILWAPGGDERASGTEDQHLCGNARSRKGGRGGELLREPCR